MDNKEQLINDLRTAAETLVKMANDESLMNNVKTASVGEALYSSERADYMTGVMQGMGLE